MKSLVIASQLIIALGLLNVWLLRAARPTAWRGGGAKNMREEFAVYGLPHWFMKLVGLLKVVFALLLIVGLFLPLITRPAAAGVVALMLGAIAMHLKVADPLKKS
ncbi:MAG: DoxX family protein, partial [Bryobacteraceae bacterium]